MTKAEQTLLRLVFASEKHRLDKEILSKYEWLDEGYFLDERTRVRLHEKEGYVDTDSNEICPLIYDKVRFFQFGRAVVCREGLWGFINEQGEEVVPCVFDEKIIPLTKNLPEPEWKSALQRINKTMSSQMFLREIQQNK